jgi:hypothetical protein
MKDLFEVQKDVLPISTNLEEIQKILEAADNPFTKSPSLFEEDIDGSYTFIAENISEIQNPEISYDLYYKFIMRTMKTGLKDLKSNDRTIIYKQKNLFLNRGKKKIPNKPIGADCRQAFSEDLNIIAKIVNDWSSKGENAYNLYDALRKLNLENGYLENDEY